MTRCRAAQTFALGLIAAGPTLSTVWAQAPGAASLPATPVTVSADTALTPRPEVKFNRPQVTCAGGQLTIAANSSTMISVLDAVHQCLGIAITAPGTPVLEPVFLQLGPGPANRVLSDLLSMTDFDYIVLSAQDHPEKIARVELLARGGDAGAAKAPPAPATTEGLSAARIAWLADRSIGRGMPAKEEEASQTAEEPKQPVVPQLANISSKAPEAAEIGASQESAVGTASQPDPNAGAVTASGITADPAPGIANQTAAANKELENKITDMQHLFEQRKKLNAVPPEPSNPGSSTTPAPGSESNPASAPS